MNNKDKYLYENMLLQKLRISNRSGSHKNCIRVFQNNSYTHERIKFDISLKLIKEGYSIWTEAIFTNGQRADIIAIKGKEAYAIEVETDKSFKEMSKKVKEKLKYPKEFVLVLVNTKDFDIEKWNL